MQQVIVVSGPPGAGKTAVAEAICERFDRMVHIEVDQLRHWVKAGYRHPWAGDPQSAEQLRLAVRNACAIARECVAARYAVVIDDVVLPEQAVLYAEALAECGALVELVTLLPDLETALHRFALGHGGPGDEDAERIRALHARLFAEVEAGALPGAVLDSTGDENANATTDRLMDAVAAGTAVLRTARGPAG